MLDVTSRRLGLTAYFSGMATAVVGLLAPGHLVRPLAVGAGTLLALGGVAVLLISLRDEPFGRPAGSAALLTLVGVSLHVYEGVMVIPGGFSLGLLAWGLTPYAVSLVVSTVLLVRREAVAGAVGALVFDFVVHVEVFTGRWDFASAFVLLERPLASAAVIVPVVMLLAHGMRRLRRSLG
jgi:hypothetical protein